MNLKQVYSLISENLSAIGCSWKSVLKVELGSPSDPEHGSILFRFMRSVPDDKTLREIETTVRKIVTALQQVKNKFYMSTVIYSIKTLSFLGSDQRDLNTESPHKTLHIEITLLGVITAELRKEIDDLTKNCLWLPTIESHAFRNE